MASPDPLRLGAAFQPGALSRALTLRLEDLAAGCLDPVWRVSGALEGTDLFGRLWLVRLQPAHRRGVCLCLSRPEFSGDALTFCVRARFDGDRAAGYRWAGDFLRRTAPFRLTASTSRWGRAA